MTRKIIFLEKEIEFRILSVFSRPNETPENIPWFTNDVPPEVNIVAQMPSNDLDYFEQRNAVKIIQGSQEIIGWDVRLVGYDPHYEAGVFRVLPQPEKLIDYSKSSLFQC